MLASELSSISQLADYFRSFDHVETIHKYRVIRQKYKGKVYESKEYLVHADEGMYHAILVYENSDGSLEYYTSRISVYKKSNSTYFTYTLPGEFEENKKLILVFLKSIPKKNT